VINKNDYLLTYLYTGN